MAYNLIAEFAQEPDWDELHRVAASLTAVECFPIPSDATGASAVGVSLPAKAVDEHGWTELERFLLGLWDNYRARVFDLYSGGEVHRDNRAELKASLLGPG